MLLMILYDYRGFKYDFNLSILSIATQHKWKTVCLHFTSWSLIIKNTSFMKEVPTRVYTKTMQSPIQGKHGTHLSHNCYKCNKTCNVQHFSRFTFEIKGRTIYLPRQQAPPSKCILFVPEYSQPCLLTCTQAIYSCLQMSLVTCRVKPGQPALSTCSRSLSKVTCHS